MIRPYLLVLLFLSAACTKREYVDNLVPTPTPVSNPATGPRFFVLPENALVLDDSTTVGILVEDSFAFRVTAAEGFSKPVKIFLTGMPDTGIGSLIGTEGILPFQPVLHLKPKTFASGFYSFTIVAYSEGDSSKTFPFSYRIRRDDFCGRRLTGAYRQTGGTSSGQYPTPSDSTTIVPVGNPNEVLLTDFYEPGKAVLGTVDCIKHTIALQSQDIGIYRFSAWGTFTITPQASSITFAISCRIIDAPVQPYTYTVIYTQ